MSKYHLGVGYVHWRWMSLPDGSHEIIVEGATRIKSRRNLTWIDAAQRNINMNIITQMSLMLADLRKVMYIATPTNWD